jgi:hypothetical protein
MKVDPLAVVGAMSSTDDALPTPTVVDELVRVCVPDVDAVPLQSELAYVL